ncbi:MAG: hypothetical protein KatS3mg087_0169 [Patescibacteria group bacterium]|nr:MAG: hypothetical protein KatS3mg087_0169 [Patescibacteria group bacterium]
MIPLEEAHKKFISHLHEKKRSKATVLAYGKDIEQLMHHLKNKGHTHVHHVRKEDIEEFMTNLISEGYTTKSVFAQNQLHQDVFSFFAD